MFELNIEQIKMVSGGVSDSSGNNYGDSGSDKKSGNFAHGQLWGGAIGGAIGSRFGPAGAAIFTIGGAYLGDDIENSELTKEALDMYRKIQDHRDKLDVILP